MSGQAVKPHRPEPDHADERADHRQSHCITQKRAHTQSHARLRALCSCFVLTSSVGPGGVAPQFEFEQLRNEPNEDQADQPDHPSHDWREPTGNPPSIEADHQQDHQEYRGCANQPEPESGPQLPASPLAISRLSLRGRQLPRLAPVVLVHFRPQSASCRSWADPASARGRRSGQRHLPSTTAGLQRPPPSRATADASCAPSRGCRTRSDEDRAPKEGYSAICQRSLAGRKSPETSKTLENADVRPR